MSAVEEDAKELLQKVYSGKISISRKNLSDKIDIRILRAINDSILETQIEGGNALYLSGKLVGATILKDSAKFSNVEMALGFLQDLFKNLMICMIVKVEQGDDNILLHIDECAFCTKKKTIINNERKCYFLTGLISGILSKGLNAQYVGKEIRCRNIGDSFCVFEFSRSNETG
jgi:predicted hydrocarbon binding protein